MHFSDTRDVETLRRNETLIDEYAKKYDAICAVPATRKVETMWRDKTELSQEKIKKKNLKERRSQIKNIPRKKMRGAKLLSKSLALRAYAHKNKRLLTKK